MQDSKSKESQATALAGSSIEYWFERALMFKECQDNDGWKMVLYCCNRALDIDNQYYKGYFLLSLAHAKLNNIEHCCNTLIDFEKIGRPDREENCFNFFTSDETIFLLSLLAINNNDTIKNKILIAVCLINFYNKDFVESKKILLDIAYFNDTEIKLVKYFVSRIEIELGNFNESLQYLDYDTISGLSENPRAHYWLAKAQISKALKKSQTALNDDMSNSESYNGFYIEDFLESNFTDVISSISTAIAIGPPRAEYYFLLGKACQNLFRRGGGFDEYHEAVKLDVKNTDYLLARVQSMYNDPWEFKYILEDAVCIVAYDEAATAFSEDIDLNIGSAVAYYQIKNYAASLYFFEQSINLINQSVKNYSQIMNSKDNLINKSYNDMHQECIDHIRLPIGSYTFQSIVKMEREFCKKLSDAYNKGCRH